MKNRKEGRKQITRERERERPTKTKVRKEEPKRLKRQQRETQKNEPQNCPLSGGKQVFY